MIARSGSRAGRAAWATLLGGVAIAAFGFLGGVGYTMAALDGVESPASGGDVAQRTLAQQARRSEEQEQAAASRHAEVMRLLRGIADARGTPAAHGTGPGGAAPSAAGVPSARTAASGAIPADRVARLAPFDGWAADEALRTQWTGAEAAKLRTWLGAADSITASETGATWRYRRTLSDGAVRTTVIRIEKGTVVSVATE